MFCQVSADEWAYNNQPDEPTDPRDEFVDGLAEASGIARSDVYHEWMEFTRSWKQRDVDDAEAAGFESGQRFGEMVKQSIKGQAA